MFTPDLPKTRSGKIMRRLLRDIAEGRPLGDTTTLADAARRRDDPRATPARRRSDVPFDFLKRKKDEPGPRAAAAAPAGAARRRAAGIPFDGLTEEWRIVGQMDDHGPAVRCAQQARGDRRSRRPVGADRRLGGRSSTAPGLKTRRPVRPDHRARRRGTLPPLTDAERTAHKVHKIAYDVALEVPPFRVVGTVYLYPGSGAGAAAGPGDARCSCRSSTPRAYRRRTGRSRRAATRRPRQPLLPARHRADRQLDRRAAATAAGRAARWHVRAIVGELRSPRRRASLTGRTPMTPGRVRRGRRPSGGRTAADRACAAARRASGRSPKSASARPSKSSVIFSLGNISMTVRPSLAARTKSRPPDRIWGQGRHPDRALHVGTATPLLARLMTRASRSRMPSSVATSRELDGRTDGGDVRRDRDEDAVGDARRWPG